MKRVIILIIIFLGSWFAMSPTDVDAFFQETEALELKINRDKGFGLGGQIQGRFSLKVSGPENLQRVEFYIDDTKMGEDSSPPYGFNFNTGDYERGTHALWALGTLSDGSEIRSNRITRQFASMQSAALIVGAIIVLIVGFRLASHYLTRGKSSTSKASYGFLGGTICSKCGQPFGIHWWSIRLGFSRFDRCPHCGKWSMVNRVSPDHLEAAEEKHREPEQFESSAAEQESDDQDELRRQLDDSRYRDE
jgi:ribosomal protein L32